MISCGAWLWAVLSQALGQQGWRSRWHHDSQKHWKRGHDWCDRDVCLQWLHFDTCMLVLIQSIRDLYLTWATLKYTHNFPPTKCCIFRHLPFYIHIITEVARIMTEVAKEDLDVILVSHFCLWTRMCCCGSTQGAGIQERHRGSTHRVWEVAAGWLHRDSAVVGGRSAQHDVLRESVSLRRGEKWSWVLSGKINLGEINLSKQLVGESNLKTVKGTEKK